MATVSIQGVTKTFDVDSGNRIALQAVNLELGDGAFVSVVGPTGCGKTTLLRITAGLVSATSGLIRIGSDLNRAPRIGMVFQESVLLPWKNVIDNVTLPGRIGRSKGFPNAKARAVELLESLGLRGTEQLYPWQLSGGMRQRVAIARALAQGRSVLLMDEPFAALDAITRDFLHEEITRIWTETGITIIFVTHNVREAVRLSERVLLMSSRPGRIIREWEIGSEEPWRSDSTYSSYVSELAEEITTNLREEIVRHAV